MAEHYYSSLRTEIESLGYNPKEKRLSRHTLNFYNGFVRNQPPNLQSETMDNLNELAEKFLNSVCTCKKSKSQECYGQQHGPGLWSSTMGAQRGLIWPEHKDKIIMHIGRMFSRHHNPNTRELILVEGKSLVDDPAAAMGPARKALAARESQHKKRGNALNGVDQLWEVRLPEHIAIAAYISSIWEFGDSEKLSHNQHLFTLLQHNVFQWPNTTIRMIERFLHENGTLYFIIYSGWQDYQLHELVVRVKGQLDVACDEQDDKSIGERCKIFISQRTKQWIFEDKFLEMFNTDTIPSYMILQSTAFSNELSSRQQVERQLSLGSTTPSIEGIFDDAACANNQVAKHKRLSHEGRHLVNVHATRTSAGASHLENNRFGTNGEELLLQTSREDVAYQDFHAWEMFNDHSQLQRFAGASSMESYIDPMGSRNSNDEHNLSPILDEVSRGLGSTRFQSLLSFPPQSVSSPTLFTPPTPLVTLDPRLLSIIPRPNPLPPVASISKSAPVTLRIEVLLRLYQPISRYSTPYTLSIFGSSSDSFFALYSNESQIPLASIKQLEFSFPDTRPFYSRILNRDDEESWEALKEKAGKLIKEVRKMSELRIFEIRVEAVGWQWEQEGLDEYC